MSSTNWAHTALQMVDEAARSQDCFERVFSDSRDAIFMLDQNGFIIDLNPAAVQMFRFSGKVDFLKHPDPAGLFLDPSQFRRFRWILFKNGTVEDFGLKLKRADGTEFEALATASLQPERLSSFAILRDVTRENEIQRKLQESETRHRRLLENSPDLIFRWNLVNKNYGFLSPALETIFGYKVDEVLRNPKLLIRAIHPEDSGFALSMHKDMIQGKTDRFEGRYRMYKKDGTMLWVRERSILLKDAKGKPVAAEGVLNRHNRPGAGGRRPDKRPQNGGVGAAGASRRGNGNRPRSQDRALEPGHGKAHRGSGQRANRNRSAMAVFLP